MENRNFNKKLAIALAIIAAGNAGNMLTPAVSAMESSNNNAEELVFTFSDYLDCPKLLLTDMYDTFDMVLKPSYEREIGRVSGFKTFQSYFDWCVKLSEQRMKNVQNNNEITEEDKYDELADLKKINAVSAWLGLDWLLRHYNYGYVEGKTTTFTRPKDPEEVKNVSICLDILESIASYKLKFPAAYGKAEEEEVQIAPRLKDYLKKFKTNISKLSGKNRVALAARVQQLKAAAYPKEICNYDNPDYYYDMVDWQRY